ncbi:MAG: BlaI/MecI/CopY family transcriptional regulator [Myxococcota bacterium]|nr:BlaI/MecI/CopY family transcriptional regulator [Myxococcota bacterium]
MNPKTDPPTPPGGELEMSLLTELWRRHPATVRQLHETVGVPRGIVYTTVAKVLDRMVDKGLVGRRAVGRAYEYEPLVDRGATHRAMARDFLARLGGDPGRPAVAALVGALEDADPELLDELEAELSAWRERNDGT